MLLCRTHCFFVPFCLDFFFFNKFYEKCDVAIYVVNTDSQHTMLAVILDTTLSERLMVFTERGLLEDLMIIFIEHFLDVLCNEIE